MAYYDTAQEPLPGGSNERLTDNDYNEDDEDKDEDSSDHDELEKWIESKPCIFMGDVVAGHSQSRRKNNSLDCSNKRLYRRHREILGEMGRCIQE